MISELSSRARHAVLDPSNPISRGSRARAGRWEELTRRFPGLDDMRVLDLGGRPQWWSADPRPASLTIVNLEPVDDLQPWMTYIVADACSLGSEIAREKFDLVVSNSLLEHVGGYDRRRKLAEVIHRVADRHWVQTPNRYFPIEPHWLAPGWQFLPIPLRARILQKWPFQQVRPADYEGAVECVLETELVSRAELKILFPQSDIWSEKFLGMTKSLVAVRS